MKSLFVCLALLGAIPAHADDAADLRRDAQALHDDIAANHPGMVDASEPRFAARNDAALAQALQRADRVVDPDGYRSALAAYAAAFDDGHLSVAPVVDAPTSGVSRWPGFLTGFDPYGDQRVVTKDADVALPLGAQLVECDGISSGDLASQRVGTFTGRWFLPSMRVRRGGLVLVDRGNPFAPPPVRCTFEYGGQAHEMVLAWRDIDPDALDERLGASSQILHAPIASRRLWNNTRWYVLSSFDGDPASVAGRALPALIAELKADAAVSTAPAIVLDLRGNNGGSSDWSLQIARAVWGRRRVAAVDESSEYVEWRATPAILAQLLQTRDSLRRGTVTSLDMLRELDATIDGVRGAIAHGQPLWREPAESIDVLQQPDDVRPRTGAVYFVTDSGCASACLDAADLFKALGAIQIGQQTGADTSYMDVRSVVLPSGRSRAWLPMKVVRNRARGSNVPLDPVHRFPGDLRDTTTLERWVTTLPESNPARLPVFAPQFPTSTSPHP